MGRGASSTAAIATGSFDSVVGLRRGEGGGSLVSATPSDDAKAEARRIRVALADGDWAPALAALAKYGAPESSPLLTDLAGELSNRLAWHAWSANAPNVRRWAEAVGVKTSESEQMVFELSGRQTMHLWMGGPDHPMGLPRSFEVVCGKKLTQKSAGRLARGAWADGEREGRLCLTCQKHAPEFPECHESASYDVCDDSMRLRLQKEFRDGPVREALLAGVAAGAGREQLHAEAEAVVGERMLECMAEWAHGGGESVMQRMMGREAYNRARRALPDKGARLCVYPYVEPWQWRQVLAQYEKDFHTPKAGVGGIAPNPKSKLAHAQAVGAAKAALAKLGYTEVAKYNRYPYNLKPRPGGSGR